MSRSVNPDPELCRLKGAMAVPSATPLLFSLLDKRDWDRVTQPDSPRYIPSMMEEQVSPIHSQANSPRYPQPPSPSLPPGITQAQMNHILKSTSAPLSLQRNKSESNLMYAFRRENIAMARSGDAPKKYPGRLSAQIVSESNVSMLDKEQHSKAQSEQLELKARADVATSNVPSISHTSSCFGDSHLRDATPPPFQAHHPSDNHTHPFSHGHNKYGIEGHGHDDEEDEDGFYDTISNDDPTDYFAQAAAGENFKFYAETYGKMLIERILMQKEPVTAITYQSYRFEVANVPLQTYAAAVCPHSQIIECLKLIHSSMKDYQPIVNDFSTDTANYTALMTFLGQRIKVSFTSNLRFPTNKSTSEVRLSRLMASSASSSSSSAPFIPSLFEEAYGPQGRGHRRELKVLHVSYISLKKQPIELNDFLNNVVIPSWSEHLTDEYKLSHLTAAVHREGIRFRDLGKVYARVPSEKVRRLLIVEMVARTKKWDIISRMHHINQVSGQWSVMKITEFKKIVAEQLNLLFGGADVAYWKAMADKIYSKFSLDPSLLSPADMRRVFFNSNTLNANILSETCLCTSEEDANDVEINRSLALLLERLRLQLGIKFSRFIKKRYNVEAPRPVRSHNPFNTSHILGFKPVIKMPSVFEFTRAQAILKTLSNYSHAEQTYKHNEMYGGGGVAFGASGQIPYAHGPTPIAMDNRHKLLLLRLARSCIERALRSDPLNDLFLLRNADVLEMMEQLTTDPQQKAELQLSIKICLETSIKFLSSDGLRRYKKTFQNCQRSQFIDFFIAHMDQSFFL